jgi:hypothetical protein
MEGATGLRRRIWGLGAPSRHAAYGHVEADVSPAGRLTAPCTWLTLDFTLVCGQRLNMGRWLNRNIPDLAYP